MHDVSQFNDDSIDIATDLVNDEEHVASSDEDAAVIVSNDNSESESGDDVAVQLSSIDLNDKISLSIDMFKLLKNVFALMKKCRLMVKFMRNHTITNEYINQYMLSNNNGKRTDDLVLDMFIRWNSSFLLLDRLIIYKNIINSMFSFPNNLVGLTEKQKQQLGELSLQQPEWELIQSLRNIMEPFLDASVVLQGQHYPTMALSFYVFHLLCCFLESTSNDELITSSLKESLRFWFKVHCKEKLPSGQIEIMIVSMVPMCA